MSDSNDDSEEKVRKMLRDLPRVKAKPDFEQRLARKIANPGTQPGRRGLQAAFADFLDFAGRIPAPAYSVAALVLVAIVSYYAFFRSGALPPPTAALDEHSSSADKAPAPGGKDEVAGVHREDERDKKVASPGDEPARSSKLKAAERAHAQTSSQQKEERAITQESGRAQESAQGVSKSRVYKEEKEDALKESAKLPDTPTNVAPTNVAPGQKAIAPMGQAPQAHVQSMKSSQYKVSAESRLATPDSLHIKDSLRADSLRKAALDSLKKK